MNFSSGPKLLKNKQKQEKKSQFANDNFLQCWVYKSKHIRVSTYVVMFTHI